MKNDWVKGDFHKVDEVNFGFQDTNKTYGRMFLGEGLGFTHWQVLPWSTFNRANNSVLAINEFTQKVFPNPFDGNIQVQVSGSNVVSVFDFTGRKVFEKEAKSNFNIVTSDWPSGIYYGIARAGHKTYTSPLVVVGNK